MAIRPSCGSETDVLVLVAYDVNTESPAGKARLRKVSKACLNKGQRVQNSVFECLLDNAEYLKLKHELELIVDKKLDSLRFYNMGNNYNGRIETIGRHTSYDPEGFLSL